MVQRVLKIGKKVFQ